MFVSKNAGANWEVLGSMPYVYVHDLQIHPRENEVIAAIHGRGVWMLDAGYVNNPSAYSQSEGSGISATAEQIAHLTGKWNLTGDLDENKMAMLLSFSNEGDVLNGELSFQFGEAELSDFSYNGTNLSFSASFDISGQILEMKGNGIINGNTIEGMLSNDMTGKAKFTGKKD